MAYISGLDRIFQGKGTTIIIIQSEIIQDSIVHQNYFIDLDNFSLVCSIFSRLLGLSDFELISVICVLFLLMAKSLHLVLRIMGLTRSSIGLANYYQHLKNKITKW